MALASASATGHAASADEALDEGQLPIREAAVERVA